MPDVFSPQKRSAVMAAIRSHGNKTTEGRLVAIFRKHKVSGWRRHAKILGKPDFIFPQLKLAVFVDGCFWHGCVQHGRLPVGNAEFWLSKITLNKKRDRLVNRALRRRGWRVVRIWEHSLSRKYEKRVIVRISNVIQQQAKIRYRLCRCGSG